MNAGWGLLCSSRSCCNELWCCSEDSGDGGPDVFQHTVLSSSFTLLLLLLSLLLFFALSILQCRFFSVGPVSTNSEMWTNEVQMQKIRKSGAWLLTHTHTCSLSLSLSFSVHHHSKWTSFHTIWKLRSTENWNKITKM